MEIVWESPSSYETLEVLGKYLENNPRWPELVTFEEMNLAPPNYGVIHELLPLLKESSPEERREIIQIVLTERNNERISRMSPEEKRHSINQFFSGHALDTVEALSEPKLDQILHTLGKQLIEKIKLNIQAEDAARFLSEIPTDDLLRYVEKIPTNDTTND